MKQKSEQDYFICFVKSAVLDLKENGVCYVYNKKQLEEVKKRINKNIKVKEVDCGLKKGYVITLR